MTTYAELRARKKARTIDVPIVLDDAWGQAVVDAQVEVEAITRESVTTLGPGGKAIQERLTEATEKLDKLQAEKDDHVAVFKFKAISNDRYERLVAAHPPTQQQRAEAAAGTSGPPQWNTATFQPALVHACLLEPRMTRAEVTEMFHPPELEDEDEGPTEADGLWNVGELAALFNGALSAVHNRHRLG